MIVFLIIEQNDLAELGQSGEESMTGKSSRWEYFGASNQETWQFYLS